MALLAGSALALTGASTAAAAAAPRTVQLDMIGGMHFEPGLHVMDDQRFSKRSAVIRSGGTIKMRNRTKTPGPHSFSLVKRSELPRSFECEACGAFFGAHQVDEETGTVGVPLVDVGAPGFDRPGDSIYIAPKARESFKVTARKGTRLHFVCTLHPWMQGSIRVR